MTTLDQALQCMHEFTELSSKDYESYGDDAYVIKKCFKCNYQIKIEYRLHRVTDQTGKEHLCDAIGRCCSKQDLTTISAVFDSGIDRVIEHMKCQNCSMQYILEFHFVEFYNDEDEDNGKIITYENGIVIQKIEVSNS